MSSGTQHASGPDTDECWHFDQLHTLLQVSETSELQASDPEALAGDMARSGVAAILCPEEVAAPLVRLMQRGTGNFLHWENGHEDCVTFPCAGITAAYKRQEVKQRLQLRAIASKSDGDTWQAASDGNQVTVDLDRALGCLETVALTCLGACCTLAGIPCSQLLQRYGDRRHACTEVQVGKGKSVLNLYHYFNDALCEEEPCREHADPGLITILCRSTNPALQARAPVPPDARPEWSKPGCDAAYERGWRDVEPAMDVCAERAGHASESGLVLIALVGETLERLSAGRFLSCRHRVASAEGERFNVAYELRPRVHLWLPWERMT